MPASSYVSLVRCRGLYAHLPLANSEGNMEKVI